MGDHARVSIPHPREAAVVRLRLLGGFGLWRNGRSVPLTFGAQRLIAYLAIRGQWLLRTHVAGTLWPDAMEQRANASLRSTVWRLRSSDLALVETTKEHVRLAPGVSVDVRTAVALARRLQDDQQGGPDVDRWEDVLSVDLLPDWYEDWVVFEREQILQLRLHALERLCERLTASGRFGQAVAAGLVAVSAEPLRESAQRALITAYLAEGNRWDALRQYRRYRQMLLAELGVEPTSQMERLMEGLRAS